MSAHTSAPPPPCPLQVIWFNGGPGCSSMEGAFSESGLYHIQEFTNPPTLMQNPFSWANFSNNLFIESPAAVGYSYCTTRAGCSHTDTSTAQDNLQALLSFFTSYPELSGRDFYITGESYAGIYIPTLAYAIYQNNIKNPSQAIALRGIMVGNGCIGNAAGHCGNDPTG
jgi:carboxypeptidase C (cathepsin A)